MNYIHFYNSFLPILFVCKKYLIPSDISFIIYKFFINSYSKIICNAWYNHIMIHNINLCDIITRLPLYMHYDSFGMPYFYYDLYDKKIGYTFNICYKYLNLNICDFDWWERRINYAFNGVKIDVDIHNNVIIYNYHSIINFYYKLYQ